MPFVITQNCCNDASCVQVCPVGCIHPTPDEPDFATTEMLYINPTDCIGCEACVEACPVDAIFNDFDIPASLAHYQAVNADYFAWSGTDSTVENWSQTVPAAADRADRSAADAGGRLRVAVVGAGPSGWYVTDELIRSRAADVEVTVIDRLPTSHGLVRYGVAPDHEETKRAAELFDELAENPRVHPLFNVDVGTDVTHDELLAHHHAVVYCTGADVGRRLGIPGEDHGGVTTSADLVQWYNGHPDHAERTYDFDTEGAVVIGNGNVALDIARLILSDPDEVARTDMADHAIEALAASRVRTVTVLGRRGVEHAAFTSPELRALADRPDLDIEVMGRLPERAAPDGTASGFARDQKVALLCEIADRPARSEATKRLVLRFDSTPVEILRTDGRLDGLRVVGTDTGEPSRIEAGLVITATGFRSAPVPDVAFDGERGRFDHADGRVVDGSLRVVGTYAAGWAKRGPSGVIGSNKACAAETVASLIDDATQGRLPEPSGERPDLEALLRSRSVRIVQAAGWLTLRDHELASGAATGRPRVKIVSREAALELVA